MTKYPGTDADELTVILEPVTVAALPPLSVTAEQAARLLGISVYTLRELTKRGEVPSFKLGGRILYPYRQLCDLIDTLVTREL
jgi:excisionase family DNA binding protein